MNFVLVTLDHHLGAALEQARAGLRRALPGVELRVHVAADWEGNAAAVERCRADIAAADLVLVTQIFLEDQIEVVLPALRERRDGCAAVVCAMCAPALMRMTRMGRFSMGGEGEQGAWSPAALLSRLRKRSGGGSAGETQMRQMRRIPRLLRWIPGTAQDVRAYYLVMQYWLAGSEANIRNLVLFLVDRYGPPALRGRAEVGEPVEYPDVGVYHPDLGGLGMAEDARALPRSGERGTVGVLLMRSYLLAGNTAHYDAVIRALETRGLRVIPAFAAGLDSRPAIDRFFRDAAGRPRIDALLSLTGFSLVGGPAYNDAAAAREALEGLDVPYLLAQALEFQSIDEWRADARGMNPLQATLMVAIPELDGATSPLVFAGKDSVDGVTGSRPVPERVERLAARVANLVALRTTPPAERRVGIVLFSFPPNAGNIGTAAFLAVWESLHRTLTAMKAEGYRVEVPATADELRERVCGGNAERFGAQANVHARIRTDDHVRRERHLREIEGVWGSAPGRQNTDGSTLWVLGERFGNVFVGVQPAFGYEGDPMRLLFERGFAPTHAFSAFYRWLREDFGAHTYLHFGTHGALEFMPGKQVGLSAECWPDRLLGDVPNVYLYASNNPSEGTLAKRRGAATLVSYLTPPVTHAGLYRGLLDLKASLNRWSGEEGGTSDQGSGATGPQNADLARFQTRTHASPGGVEPADDAHADLVALIQAQAAAVDLAAAEPAWQGAEAERRVARLRDQVLELEYSLIPHGMHVVGEGMGEAERIDTLAAMTEAPRASVEALVRTGRAADAALEPLEEVNRLLARDHEIPALLRALDGRFIPPAPGGDLLRTPAVLPTGRNLYGFDPFRVPSAFAMRDGRRQAERLLERHRGEHGSLPATVAMVLWGTDNMKSEGGPIAQALALMGAEAAFDGYGRLTGARLLPLAELGRPRIDVVLTLSGIFRDLLPLQVRLLAEAAWLAASAEEPESENFVRRHTLARMVELGCDLETAALRVFSNAEGAYGANVNLLVESGAWSDGAELADAFVRRKSFAYGRGAASRAAPDVMRSALAAVELTYQNLESVELGVSDVDQYMDSLGGLSRAAAQARGASVPAYIGDQTRGEGKVRTLDEQVALEARTRMLNPRWYEGMLRYGYEGVRQIEAHVTTTLGWSATNDAVAPWVYAGVGETFLLDPEMRERLAALNPTASARMASRLLEAHDRGYWAPDDDTLDALRQAADELEDRLEGIYPEAAA